MRKVSKRMPSIWGVLFTSRNDDDTDHSVYATVDDAKRVGAALARHYWESYGRADGNAEPFPADCEDEWAAMDAFRSRYPARLEVEEIQIGASLAGTIAEALGDAVAYRTDSGELPEGSMDSYEKESVERYRTLAEQIGLTLA